MPVEAHRVANRCVHGQSRQTSKTRAGAMHHWSPLRNGDFPEVTLNRILANHEIDLRFGFYRKESISWQKRLIQETATRESTLAIRLPGNAIVQCQLVKNR